MSHWRLLQTFLLAPQQLVLSRLIIESLFFIRVFFRRNFMRDIASLIFHQVVLMALVVQPFASCGVWSYETLKNWFLACKFNFL